jgi:streptogrisin C
MLPRKTVTVGIALAVTLISVPALAFAAKGATAQDDTPYAIARANAESTADHPRGLLDAVSRDLGITAQQAETRLINEAAAATSNPRCAPA